jgi:uncharacterized protein YprB with RNaseH-like and TPR domain
VANLRDRLKVIQEQKKNEIKNDNRQVTNQTLKKISPVYSDENSTLKEKGWIACGYKTVKREIFTDSPFFSKTALPQSLPVIIHDLSGNLTQGNTLPDYCDFIFFDLETTGLSGGAGTLAFLAAFGCIVKHGSVNKLKITQYLLLDYPGENDFLDAVLKEFSKTCVIVTYNGKCFDSQILKNRCLMNRIKPPEYHHVDLLFPARRLWKNIIQDCSQSSIETKILGLDRSTDIPGALAPEIWFEFLKTERTDRLMGICDHNTADIKGLAVILSAMNMIAEDPFNAKYNYDTGRLALFWRFFCRHNDSDDLQKTGDKLLRFAVQKNINCLPYIKAAIYRALAIDCERKEKNYELAMEYVNEGLLLNEISENLRNEFERRKERLEKKLSVAK